MRDFAVSAIYLLVSFASAQGFLFYTEILSVQETSQKPTRTIQCSSDLMSRICNSFSGTFQLPAKAINATL